MDRRVFLTAASCSLLAPAAWATQSFSFPSIDGGSYEFQDWRGQPLLVVNTASLCGFTGQYDGLQELHETYAGRARVLAVPSDDFAQELGSEAEVAEFCEINFGLTLPMTTIQPVLGPRAHSFYRWLAQTHSFAPRWNFNKVLLDANGALVSTWGSGPEPMGRQIRDAIDGLLTA